MGSDEARELADKPELCALVCEHCHQTYVDKDDYRDSLLRLNYELWGYAVVQASYNAVHAALKAGILWELPNAKDE